MRYDLDGAARNLRICYVGGGSRGWAWSFMADVVTDEQIGGEICLYDIDREAASRNRLIGEKMAAHPSAKSAWRFTVSDTLEEALRGANFVVISILPGTFSEMRCDVHAPEAYGIWQSVGDTTGAGGFVRGMRTVPMITHIARAIAACAPDAWVINYTNPMALCVRALYEAFPQIRAFGCCHEVFGTQKLLASMLKAECGVENAQREDIRTTVTGVNHFTWLTTATYQGIDLFPLYERFVDKHYDAGYEEERGNWTKDVFTCAHRVKFDLFRRFGLIAAAGDRHLAEFMPCWYLRDPACAHGWKFSLTPVDWRVNDLAKRLARSDALLSGAETVSLKPSGEEGHLLMKALLGLGELVSNVNVPNRGQIGNLPQGTIVETNAYFARNLLQPLHAGALPDNLLPYVARHAYMQENALRAALTCDRKLALTAFLSDPQITLSPEDGRRLLDEMLEGTRAYLPKEWFA